MLNLEFISIENLFSKKNMQSIVDSIGSLINHHVVICNREGTVIAATNRARLGVRSKDIARMLQNDEDMLIVDYHSENSQDFLPGVNQRLLYKGAVVGSLGITGEPSEVQVFCKIVRSFVQQQLLELNKEKSKANQRQLLSSFVYNWIFADGSQDAAEFALRAKSFGIDTTKPKTVCLVSCCPSPNEKFTIDQRNQDVLLYLERFMEDLDTTHVVSILGQTVILLLDTENPTQAKAIMTDIKAVLQQQLHVDCAIGIGRTCRDPQELKLSYESAQLACNTSRDTPDHQIVVFELFDLALLISTVNRRHLQQVFNYVFRNYADNATVDESVNILQVYIDTNRSVDQTAQILNLHKNTVQYRLNKICELTGYNPRCTRDLTFLHTAVLIYHMGIRKTNELL